MGWPSRGQKKRKQRAKPALLPTQSPALCSFPPPPRSTWLTEAWQPHFRQLTVEAKACEAERGEEGMLLELTRGRRRDQLERACATEQPTNRPTPLGGERGRSQPGRSSASPFDFSLPTPTHLPQFRACAQSGAGSKSAARSEAGRRAGGLRGGVSSSSPLPPSAASGARARGPGCPSSSRPGGV